MYTRQCIRGAGQNWVAEKASGLMRQEKTVQGAAAVGKGRWRSGAPARRRAASRRAATHQGHRGYGRLRMAQILHASNSTFERGVFGGAAAGRATGGNAALRALRCAAEVPASG